MIFHLTCLDQQGIIAQFTQLLFQHYVNVFSLEQHVEPEEGLFFMRIHTDLRNMTISSDALIDHLNDIANKLSGNLIIHNPLNPLNMAILCTKEQAHVSDLLMKYKSGELNCKISMVISNHDDLRDLVEQSGTNYHHLPVSVENKKSQEQEILSLLEDQNIDVVVLARYMQVLSPQIVNKFEGRIINIHHAFLPAFKGNRPYRKAWVRGVKMIGATAHYVTEKLDEGPIIEQDVESVTHQYSVKEMIQAGRDIERRVLTSAVKAHLQHRILLHGQRTLIFHS
ncbi:formyltetrahydrofolate deformylase [Candidatus Marinimicrobia bacterium]|nr:formyltetrahydrofolate deformylase [Candidatus Neomarinimicrobiota bacterium]